MPPLRLSTAVLKLPCSWREIRRASSSSSRSSALGPMFQAPPVARYRKPRKPFLGRGFCSRTNDVGNAVASAAGTSGSGRLPERATAALPPAGGSASAGRPELGASDRRRQPRPLPPRRSCGWGGAVRWAQVSRWGRFLSRRRSRRRCGGGSGGVARAAPRRYRPRLIGFRWFRHDSVPRDSQRRPAAVVDWLVVQASILGASKHPERSAHLPTHLRAPNGFASAVGKGSCHHRKGDHQENTQRQVAPPFGPAAMRVDVDVRHATSPVPGQHQERVRPPVQRPFA
jgi:hypothetical protein